MKIFAGTFKGRTLKAPKSSATRPTKGMVREAVFNICQGRVEGTRFLDLFAGSGSMGFEALSRGARHVTFVEQDRGAIQCIRGNARLLQVEERVDWIASEVSVALKQLAKRGEQFDLIYIDPPYEQVEGLAEGLLQQVEEGGLLASGGLLFLEGPCRKVPLSFALEILQLLETRSFGDTQLYLFSI